MVEVWVKNFVWGKRPADVVLKVDSNDVQRLIELEKELKERGFDVQVVELREWIWLSSDDIITEADSASSSSSGGDSS